MDLSRWAGALVLATALPAAAGLPVHVRDARGIPIADAVISVSGTGVPAAPPATRIIDQKDERFVPYVEAFRVGDRVVFHNGDPTRHHVYSFAPLKSFEFVMAPGASTEPITLDRPGVAAVGCNIHDQMIAYLHVTAAPWSARTGADGSVALPDLAPGTYTVEAWHPQLRPGAAAVAQTVTLPSASAAVAFSLALLPDPRRRHDAERSAY